MTEANLKDLKLMAQKIRCHIIRMTTLAGSGHPGGSHSDPGYPADRRTGHRSGRSTPSRRS